MASKGGLCLAAAIALILLVEGLYLYSAQSWARIFSQTSASNTQKNKTNEEPAPFQKSQNQEEAHGFKARPIEERKSELEVRIERFSSALEAEGVSLEAFEASVESQQLSDYRAELQDAWSELSQEIKKIQSKTLEEDGMPKTFLEPFQSKLPRKLEIKLKALDRLNISKVAQQFINERAQASSISDQDVKDLVFFCRNDRPCVEKGAKIWLDANHLLTEEQIKMIEERSI